MSAIRLNWSALKGIVGKPLVRVRYFQLRTDGSVAEWSILPEFDSVDLGVELTASDGCIALVRWELDEVTDDYGLCADGAPWPEGEGRAAVDVVSTSRWAGVVGAVLDSVEEARWRQDSTQDTDYPPALVMRFHDDKLVVLAAAEYVVSRKQLSAGADGVTVFFSYAAATAAGIVLQPQ